LSFLFAVFVAAATTGEIVEMFSSGVLLAVTVYTAAKAGKSVRRYPARRRR